MTKIAILGGGLAGTACAYVLKKKGFAPVIYEAGPALAGGASGNDLGLYNPRLSAAKNAESDYFSYGFNLALQIFADLKNIDWNPCGSLHLITNKKRQERFSQCFENWNWPPEQMQMLDTGQASAVAGIEIDYPALYLPRAGTVSPRKLCAAYAEDVEIIYNHPVRALTEIEADIIILACARNVVDFTALPVKTVRGQVTKVRATALSQKLRCNLCYGGYIASAREGTHTLGATFQRWLDHTDILEEDDTRNIAQLAEVAPQLGEHMQVTGHRAALRATGPDHVPMVGRLEDNLYVSTAHGSHGILSTLAAAHILAAMISGERPPVSEEVLQKINPARF